MTKIISTKSSNAIEITKSYLENCAVIVFPTETVYGIGTLLKCEQAVERIYHLKKRDRNKPMLLHVSTKKDVTKYAMNLNQDVFKVIEAFWPGSLSIILDASPFTPRYAVSEDGTVGLRMPSDDFFLRLSRETGPLIATSANISGFTPSLTIEQAVSQFGEAVDLYVDGGKVKTGKASTILDMRHTPPRLIREGAIKSKEIERVIGKIISR